MKRGLSITLGTIAMAVVVNSAFANAPVFQRIPDVIIGDLDDNQHGLTVDVNFFRYDNAFNILDFITDETTSLLRFSFAEGTTHQNVSINSKHNLDAAGVNPLTNHPAWRTNSAVEITGGGANYWFSFRDLLRSPDNRVGVPDPVSPLTEAEALARRFPDPVDLSSNPVLGFPPTLNVQTLPWQNIAGSNALGTDDDPSDESAYKRLVVLYASDGSTVSWKSFYVWSCNDVYDTLSGGFTTIFSDDFAASTQWAYFSATSFLPAAGSGSGGGMISLTDSSTGTSYGGWQLLSLPDPYSLGITLVGPISNIEQDEIYAAHFFMEHNAPNRGSAPVVRLRAQMPNEIVYYQWYIRGFGNPDDAGTNPAIPDPDTEKQYNFYWSPNSWAPNFDALLLTIVGHEYDARTYTLAFETLDEFNVYQGTWKLNYVEVGCVDRPATETTDLSITDLTKDGPYWDGEGYNTALGSPLMSLTQDSPASGMITFVDPGVDLTPPGNDPPNWLIEGYYNVRDWTDTVYRVTARLSYPTASDRQNAHRFRVRHNTAVGDQLISEFWLNQNFQNPNASLSNPMLPIVANGVSSVYTRYELYINGQGGATSYLGTLGWNKWGLFLDQLYQNPNPYTVPANIEQQPTKTSVHAVLYESLGPLGI